MTDKVVTESVVESPSETAEALAEIEAERRERETEAAVEIIEANAEADVARIEAQTEQAVAIEIAKGANEQWQDQLRTLETTNNQEHQTFREQISVLQEQMGLILQAPLIAEMLKASTQQSTPLEKTDSPAETPTAVSEEKEEPAAEAPASKAQRRRWI